MYQSAVRLLLLMILAVLLLPVLSGCGNNEDDIEAPVLTLDSLHEDNANKTGTTVFKVVGADLTLSGTVEAGALVEVEVNNAEPVVATVTGDNWEYTLANSSLAEGTNTMVVSAEDSIGNKRSLTFFVVKDTTGPEVTLERHISPAITGDMVLGGIVDVGSEVDVYVDNVLDGSADVNGTVWSYEVSGLANGQVVFARAADDVGNSTDSEPLTVSIDAAAPLILINEPFDLQTLYNTATLNLSGSRESDATVSVEFVSSPDPETLPVVGTVNYDSATTWDVDVTNISSGIHVVEVTVNSAGNTAIARGIVSRDFSAPTVVGNFPAHGETTSGVPSAITVTFSEAMEGNTIITEVDVATDESPSMTVVDAAGNLVNGVIDFDDPTRTATYTPLDSLASPETYTVTVKSTVTDALGNLMGVDYAWLFKTN